MEIQQYQNLAVVPTRQIAFCQVLQKITVPETSYMFLLERNLMNMATSGLAAGCVYALVFRHESNYNVRYCESVIFAGFFEGKGKSCSKL